MKLACKLNNGSSFESPSYIDETQGPIKPGFQFYKWLGRGPPLQVQIPRMLVLDEAAPLRHIFTNARGFIEVETPKFALQTDRDNFANRYTELFITQSTPNNTPAEPVYNRTVAVAKYSILDRLGEVNHMHQKVQILTPLTVQSMLLQAVDSHLDSCVLQQFIRCRGTHANIYRVIFKSTSVDNGIATGYNISNATTDYRLIDLITSLSNDYNSNLYFTANTTAEMKSKQNQTDLMYRRKATRIIAQYIRAAITHEQNIADVKAGKVLKTKKAHSPSRRGSVQFTVCSHVDEDTSPTRPARIRRGNSSDLRQMIADYTADQLSDSEHRPTTRSPLSKSSTFMTSLTEPADKDKDAYVKRTLSPQKTSTRKVLAHLLRHESALTFNPEKAVGGETQHQSQLHKYLDVFQQKSNDELTRLFILGMSLNIHMSKADIEEAVVIGKYIHDLIGPHHNVCSMTDNHTNLTDAMLKALTVTRVSEHAMGTVKQYVLNIGKWLQSILLSQYKLSVQFDELVCDFIRDEHNNYYFVNLKGFQITQESMRRVRLWHERSSLGYNLDDSTNNASEGGVRLLSSSEWRVKQSLLAATTCKLCGQQYQPNDTTAISPDVIQSKTVDSTNKTKTSPNKQSIFTTSKTVNSIGDSNDDIDSYIEAQTALLFARRNTIGSKFIPSPSKSRLFTEVGSSAISSFIADAQGVRATSEDKKSTTEVPSLGYKLTTRGATQLVAVYNTHRHPLTTFAQGLLDASSNAQLKPTEGARKKKSETLVDCCYSCFQLYRQHKKMRRRLLKLMRVVFNSKSFSESVEGEMDSSSGEDEGGTKRASASDARSRSGSPSRSHSPTVHETQPINSATSPLVYCGVAGIVRARPKSAGSVRRPLSATTHVLPSQLALALAEGEKQVGIIVKDRGGRNRPSSARSQRSESRDANGRDVTTGVNEVIPRIEIPPLHVSTVKVKHLTIQEQKFAALHKYLERRNQVEISRILSQNSLGGVSRGDRLRDASFLPSDASQFRLFVMVHYLIPEQSQVVRAEPITGCISYILGQAPQLLNFEHSPSKHHYSGSNQGLIWIRQCRMHYAVGTPKDMNAHFQKKRIHFQVCTYNNHVHHQSNVQNHSRSQIPLQTRPSSAQTRPTSALTTARDTATNPSSLHHQSNPQPRISSPGSSDYEITKCVPMNYDSEEDDVDGDSEEENVQRDTGTVESKNDGVSAQGDGDQLSVLVEEEDEENSFMDSTDYRITAKSNRTVIQEGSFHISLEQMKWVGSAVRDGSEKIDIFVPMQLSTFGRVTAKISVAVIKDPSPLPAALHSINGGFTVDEGVFFPPKDYCDGQYALPEPWLSMLTEKPVDKEYTTAGVDLEVVTTDTKLALAVIPPLKAETTISSEDIGVSDTQTSLDSPPQKIGGWKLLRMAVLKSRENAVTSTANSSDANQTNTAESAEVTSLPGRNSRCAEFTVQQPRSSLSYLNNSAAATMRQSAAGAVTSATKSSATRQSFTGMRRTFVGQLYSALEQLNGTETSHSETRSRSDSRGGSTTEDSSSHAAAVTHSTNRVSIREVLDGRDSITLVPQRNAFIDQYQQEVNEKRNNKLNSTQQAELSHLCSLFEVVINDEVKRQDSAAIANSRNAKQLMQHANSVDSADTSEVAGVIPTLKARKSSVLLSLIAKKNALNIDVSPKHTTAAATSLSDTSSSHKIMKPSEMVGTVEVDDDSSDSEDEGDKQDDKAADTTDKPADPPITTTPHQMNMFQKLFHKVIQRKRKASLASTLSMCSFEAVLDRAMIDFHQDGVLSRHMGVIDSKEAVTMLSTRLNEIKIQQRVLSQFRTTMLRGKKDVVISEYMFDLMHMTLKRFLILDCLPERINWDLLKPMLLEELYGLIHTG